MTLDPIKEATAHFIGLFQITIEDMRLRSEYEAFRAAKAKEDDPGALPNVEVLIRSPYELEGFQPGLKLSLPVPPVGSGSPVPPQSLKHLRPRLRALCCRSCHGTRL